MHSRMGFLDIPVITHKQEQLRFSVKSLDHRAEESVQLLEYSPATGRCSSMSLMVGEEELEEAEIDGAHQREQMPRGLFFIDKRDIEKVVLARGFSGDIMVHGVSAQQVVFGLCASQRGQGHYGGDGSESEGQPVDSHPHICICKHAGSACVTQSLEEIVSDDNVAQSRIGKPLLMATDSARGVHAGKNGSLPCRALRDSRNSQLRIQWHGGIPDQRIKNGAGIFVERAASGRGNSEPVNKNEHTPAWP